MSNEELWYLGPNLLKDPGHWPDEIEIYPPAESNAEIKPKNSVLAEAVLRM